MAPAMCAQSYSSWIVHFLLFLILSPAEVIAGYPRLTARQGVYPSSFSTAKDTSEDVSTPTLFPSETFTSTGTLSALSTRTVPARCTVYVESSVTVGYYCDVRSSISSTQMSTGNAPRITTVVETVTVTGHSPNNAERPSPSQVSIFSTFHTVTSPRWGNYSKSIIPSSLSTLNATSGTPWPSQDSSNILSITSMNGRNGYISAPSTSGTLFISGSSQTASLLFNTSRTIMSVPYSWNTTKTGSWPTSITAFNSTPAVTSPLTDAPALKASTSSVFSASTSSMLHSTNTTSKPSFVNATNSISAMNTSLAMISTAITAPSSFLLNNTTTSAIRSASNASTPLINPLTTAGATYSASSSASTRTSISGSSTTTVSESPFATAMAQFSYPGPNDTWRDPYLDEMIRNATVCKVYSGDEPDPNCPIGNCKPTKDDPCVNFAQIWDDPVVRHMIAPPSTRTQTSSTGKQTGSSYTSLTTPTTTSDGLVPQESGHQPACDENCDLGVAIGLSVGIPVALLAIGIVRSSVGFGFFRATSTGQWFNFGRILNGFTRELSESTDSSIEFGWLQELEGRYRQIDRMVGYPEAQTPAILPERPATLPPPAGPPIPPENPPPVGPPPDPPGPPGPPPAWNGNVELEGNDPGDGAPPVPPKSIQIDDASALYRELSKPVQPRFKRTREEEKAEEEALTFYIREYQPRTNPARFRKAVNKQFHENHLRDAEYWREIDPSRSLPNPSPYLNEYINEPAEPWPVPSTESIETYIRAATDAVKGIPDTKVRDKEFRRFMDKIYKKMYWDASEYIGQAPDDSAEQVKRAKQVRARLRQIQGPLREMKYDPKLVSPDFDSVNWRVPYEYVPSDSYK